MSADRLVSVTDLGKHFGGGRRMFGPDTPVVRAVDGVSLEIGRRQVVGLVGESGSGKTTVGRLLMRLTDPTSGRIVFDGVDITGLRPRQMLPFRRRMQMIFQDPFASLNPRRKVGNSMVEALTIHRVGTPRERRDQVVRLMERVGLSARHFSRYPHEFSGGQRQRIVIARALALEPDLIVADEPVSALDVSIQAQIVNLLVELQRDLGLAMLFVSHDLSVVQYLCDEVVVMYLGRVMERGSRAAIFDRPHHPYTRALLSAVPDPDPDATRTRIMLEGDVPSPSNPPSGCVFHTRCAFALDDCRHDRPAERSVEPAVEMGHRSACIRDDLPR